jgi:acetyl esterase/lipase
MKFVTLKIKVHKPRKIPKGGCPAMVSFAGECLAAGCPARVQGRLEPGSLVYIILTLYPGGGYVLHDFDMAADLCHRWTALGGIAIDIGYRIAPEHQFPIPVRDCYEGLKWVAQNHQDLGLDPDKGFIVAGESSGADFALVAAHLYIQEGLYPPLTGIYASMPCGVSKETVPEKYKDRLFSFEQCKKVPLGIDLESYEFTRDHYDPDPKSPLAYPVAFPDHSYLPRTYFQVCGLDPLRDCGLILDQVLKDAGVETKLDVYPGMTHAFWTSFRRYSWGTKAIQDSNAGLTWLLRKE